MKEDDELPKEEADRRAQAVAHRMLNTPPQPHGKQKPKPEPFQKRPEKSSPKRRKPGVLRRTLSTP